LIQQELAGETGWRVGPITASHLLPLCQFHKYCIMSNIKQANSSQFNSPAPDFNASATHGDRISAYYKGAKNV
jgi:hypothetical protein